MVNTVNTSLAIKYKPWQTEPSMRGVTLLILMTIAVVMHVQQYLPQLAEDLEHNI